MNEEKQTCNSFGKALKRQEEGHQPEGARSQSKANGGGEKKPLAEKKPIMSASEIKTRHKRSFWKKVSVVEGSCWIWTGAIHGTGYGIICINGRHTSPHRVSWLIHNGDIPDDLICCHRCDVRACVNPAHIFLGTQADNMNDKADKGRCNPACGDRNGSRTRPDRLARGEANPRAKLTEDKVRKIRDIYALGKTSGRRIAKSFGVCPDVISSILRRKLWAHVA